MKMNVDSLPHYLNLAKDFPEEVKVLAKHLRCYKEDISIQDDLCGDYVVIVKGEWWGMINDIEYLMENKDEF